MSLCEFERPKSIFQWDMLQGFWSKLLEMSMLNMSGKDPERMSEILKINLPTS